jgi:hypothetical protein
MTTTEIPNPSCHGKTQWAYVIECRSASLIAKEDLFWKDPPSDSGCAQGVY